MQTQLQPITSFIIINSQKQLTTCRVICKVIRQIVYLQQAIFTFIITYFRQIHQCNNDTTNNLQTFTSYSFNL